MAIPLYVLFGAILVWSLYRLLQVGRRHKDYPPGPPTIPILGNIHQMPKSDPHLKFQQWANEYGPIFSLMLGTKVMVVLSKDYVVKDLLDKKSAIYSSRPDLYIGQTLVSGGHRFGLMPYGPMWRMQRKLAHNALNIKKAVDYIPYQEMENKQLLYDVMQNSSGLFEHVRRFASSLTTSVVYGFRWKTFDDPLLQTLFRSVDEFVRLNETGGAALADFFPILRYLPPWLSSAKREAMDHHAAEQKLYNSLWLKSKHAIVNKLPSARACTCVDVIEMQQQEKFSEDFAAHIPGTFFEAGSDTTSTELYAFVQALLLYPEAQQKGQAEVDAVVGNDRLPTLEDIPNLPYTRASVKETFRWFPTTILGAIPHATTEDDYYNGYHIPKDATIILNTWTIHRDPARHPRPERFEPERYLGDETSSADSANLFDVSKRDHFVFGAGRRICPGMHIADRSMFLAVSRFYWAFDVRPKKDKNGNDILPVQDKCGHGFVTIPDRYQVEITPRSEKKAEMVRSEWEKAQQALDENGQFLTNPI